MRYTVLDLPLESIHPLAFRAAEARKGGATATPSFILARTDPQNPTQVTGITFLRGAQSFSTFKAAIDKALAAPAKQ